MRPAGSWRSPDEPGCQTRPADPASPDDVTPPEGSARLAGLDPTPGSDAGSQIEGLARDAEAGRHEADGDLTSNSLTSVLLLRAMAHVRSKTEGESVIARSSTWR
jgi:hypothetical protein